jgi:sugar-specific transcriptional regulator TrmB
MNIVETLQSAGLSEKEAAAYIDLLQYGESQTGRICKRTKIPSSHIYTILNNLLEKGLISFKLVNNIKVFKAAEPDTLTHLFDEKEQTIRKEKEQLLKSISELKVMPSAIERLTDFKYYHGLRGIKSLYTEIMNSWKRADEYYIASAPLESFTKLEGFFLDVLHRKRIKDKVKLKILINKDSERWGLPRKKMPFTEVKYMNIKTQTEYGVMNDYFWLVSYGKEAYALLIKDKNFASTYKAFFEILWDNAEA